MQQPAITFLLASTTGENNAKVGIENSLRFGAVGRGIFMPLRL